MRQQMSLLKGAFLLWGVVLLQSLTGRAILTGRVMLEADLALLVLLSFALGRNRGTLLGVWLGVLRGSLSAVSFGPAVLILAAIGTLSGVLGEKRPFLRMWQKGLLIFGAVWLSGQLLSPAFFRTSLLSAGAAALLGVFLSGIFHAGQTT